ncbi:hypothetical protein BsWGS_26577 [Bradybaena similaris]
MAHFIDSDCNYEVEYTATEAAGLHERRRLCIKNPRHVNFHPIGTLAITSLPEVFQTKEVFNAIKVIADLTVRIRSEYTSMSRPATLPESSRAYAGAELRGCSAVRFGTGFIGKVRLVKNSDNLQGRSSSCPCFICKSPKNIPCEDWGEISIITAAHVLCTPDELVHSEVDCFYDDDDNDANVKILYGNSMRASENSISKVSFSDDYCQFSVITHDIELCEKLGQHTIYDLVSMDLGFQPTTKTSITIIVSHPHGLTKCVSWGDRTSSDILDPEAPVKHRYRYSTPTCPGSSGALVWVLENLQNKWQKVYVHSAGLSSGFNISGSVDVFGEFISSDVPCHIS